MKLVTGLIGKTVKIVSEYKLPGGSLHQEAIIRSVYLDPDKIPMYTIELPDGRLHEAYSHVFAMHYSNAIPKTR